MILCQISDADMVGKLSPQLATAVQWIQQHWTDELAKGSIEINDGVIVNVQEPALQNREQASLEAHKKFIDIHVPLKGTETMGWTPVGACKHVRQAYDEENDFMTFGDSAHSLLHVKKGQIAVFFPEDAHAPNIGLGNHRKLCLKIPV
ncbi:MAG: DUF386 domain-containing protein [Bacteroidales bacterium]|nr:DUF386 domain-containing protein [Bacteroidales bacterium]